MAPTAVESTTTTAPAPSSLKSEKTIDLSIFPDGFKTSGQHPPVYDQLYPYSAFPISISGPTVWEADDYAAHPERWTHAFSAEEIAELSDAADTFIRLTSIQL